MSIHKIVLTEAKEKYAPPGREIELSVIGDNLFITIFNGSDDNIPSTKKREYEVPVLSVKDFVLALGALEVFTVGPGVGTICPRERF